MNYTQVCKTPEELEDAETEYSLLQIMNGVTNVQPGEPELARELRASYPEESAKQLFERMDAIIPADAGPETITIRPEPEAVAAWAKLHPRPKLEKPAKKANGTFKAKRVNQLIEPVRVIPGYPAYRISARGDVWGPRGTKLRWRWFRCIPWVVLYDHEGRRHENQLFYLLVAAGWEKDWKKKVVEV